MRFDLVFHSPVYIRPFWSVKIGAAPLRPRPSPLQGRDLVAVGPVLLRLRFSNCPWGARSLCPTLRHRSRLTKLESVSLNNRYRRSVLPFVVLLLLSGSSSGQQPLFRSGTEVVDLYVTVTDEDGRLVPNLTRDDFAIFDDDEPQDITLFETDIRPITVVVMLDTSASMTPNLDLLKAGAEQFLIRLLPEDRGRVGAFNDKIQVEPAEFSGDRDLLIDALSSLDFGNPTRLYDAIDVSLEALSGVEGRKVVLVFTDGDDTDSDIGWREILRKAVSDDVMLYAIGLESSYFNGIRNVRSRPDRNLRKLSEETGGGYFELRATDELGPTFTRVARELHSQYVLGFAPTRRDGQTHELRVLIGRRGMEARARRSYLAPSDEDTLVDWDSR